MQTLSNQQNIGDMFLAYIKEASPELCAKWGAKWSEVPEKYACAQELFAHLATYMVNEYVSPVTGRHLEKVSAEALWSGLLQQSFGKSTVDTTKVRACPPAPLPPALDARTRSVRHRRAPQECELLGPLLGFRCSTLPPTLRPFQC